MILYAMQRNDQRSMVVYTSTVRCLRAVLRKVYLVLKQVEVESTSSCLTLRLL